jgi:Xaa-Pro aminopeptidase
MADSEIQTKSNRLSEFLSRHKLDGVLLGHRANFAWITCGKDNYIPSNSQNGVAAILATGRERICFTNTIESPRFVQEELAGTGIQVVAHPWHDAAAGRKALAKLIGGRRIAADVSDTGEFDRLGAGLQKLPEDFVQLRWSLTAAEVGRYRQGGRLASAAIESACRKISPKMTEHQIAGILDERVRAGGLLPVVTLVAADARLEKFRHPIPTDLRVQRYCMLVTCASLGGLISNITRVVSFEPLTARLKKRQRAVCNVDAAINLSTRPGKTLGQMFAVIQKAYAENGFAGEWANHHQGGSTGYAGREAFAVPGLSTKVLQDQAFAWNPSIAGVKSEDTILCTAEGVEFLTSPSATWPKIQAKFGKRTVERADILVRD